MDSSSPVTELGRRCVQPVRPAHQVLDGARRKQAVVDVQQIDAEIFGAADPTSLAQPLHQPGIASAANLGITCDTADSVLTLIFSPTKQEVRHPFLRYDMSHVVAVNYDRAETACGFLGQLQAVSAL